MSKLTTEFGWVMGPALLVLIWLITGWLGLLNPLFIPPLPIVLTKLVSMIFGGEVIGDLLSTAGRTVIGFSLGAVIGIPLGLVLGSNEAIYKATAVLVDFFRSIPGTALFPLFLLLFGIGDEAKIGNAAFACSLIILVNSMYGVRNANRLRILSARTMGASEARVYIRVILPSALPEIAGGLRIAVSIALVVIVVTEMFIGTAIGLGKRIFQFYGLFQIPEMYATILLTGLVGYGFNSVLMAIERRFIHWGGR